MGPAGENDNQDEKDDQACRVYVGNLAWEVTDNDLANHMRSAGGSVRNAVIFYDAKGRSKGCGIVKFETPEQAQEAIEKLSDTELLDRKIFVREDRKAYSGFADRPPRYAGGGTEADEDMEGDSNAQFRGCQVFVGNLSYRTRWHTLKDLFRPCGEVIRAEIFEYDGRSKGCGTVLFKFAESARLAIEKYDKYELDGRILNVRIDTGPKRHPM